MMDGSELQDTELYHITDQKRAADILNTGLQPAAAVGRRNTQWGVSGDPAYIYLWNAEVAAEKSRRVVEGASTSWTEEEDTLLGVAVPQNHHVERDYDQFLFILDDIEQQWADKWKSYADDKIAGDGWRTRVLNTRLQDRGLDIRFTGDATEERLAAFADRIPADDWQSSIGAYRTAEPIPATYVKDVGFDYLVADG